MTRPPPSSTLFPYTTLFRSGRATPVRGFLTNGASTEPVPRSGSRVRRMTARSEGHTSELQSRRDLVCRLLLEKKNRRGRPSPVLDIERGRHAGRVAAADRAP